ncbi:MAG: ATP synthase F1 subunit delta [Flavobacteriaceae bacterium]|nr:ATP synthase F1 subunit delta [Flavobacteriaceae bacterium]
MKGTRAALRYAKATLNLAKDKGLAKDINNDMLLIDQTIDENPDLQIMLKSPIIKSGVKKSALTEIFAKNINPLTLGLINLLIENKRLPLLPLVAKEYVIIYDFLQGVEVALVTSAIPLTKELEASLLKKVEEIIGKQITVKNIVDPSIIGGFILRVGDKQYDASISHQLNSLLTKFEDNQYISKL